MPTTRLATLGAPFVLPRLAWLLPLAKPRLAHGSCVAGLAALALAIALFRLPSSGPLWPDAPRYVNGAAMIHDWQASGAPPSILRFAEANYRQYPAFSIPYHPPAYPAVLAAVFAILGENYEVARLFIAASWALCGWLFLGIGRELGLSFLASACGSLLLLTTPELAIWSRDTMSEVPSLAVVFAGTWSWIRWCQGGSLGWAVGAAMLALAAFFFRISTAGVLPGWAVYAVLAGHLTRRRAIQALGLAVLYLAAGIAWVAFAMPYAAHEFGADGKGAISFHRFFEYFRECGVAIFASGTTAACLGALALVRFRPASPAAAFWLCWLGSYLLFKLMVTTSLEPRHFFTALPALAGLAAAAADPLLGSRRAALMIAVAVLGFAGNLVGMSRIPRGVRGYQAVAECLAKGEQTGNILLATPEDQDLIFRYRAASPTLERRCIRSDRTLAIRVSRYAEEKAEVLAHTPAEVNDLIRKGRIRYVVGFVPEELSPDTRTEEMILVHAAATSQPGLFRRIGAFPLTIDYAYYTVRPRGTAIVWEYLGELPPGPDELPTVIPTAGLVLKP